MLLAACKPAPVTPKSEAEIIPTGIAVPEKGAYLGAYIDSGDDEDDVSLDRLVEFEELAGKKQAIVASSSYWGQQTFPSANLRIISRHGSIPLLFWSPVGQALRTKQGPRIAILSTQSSRGNGTSTSTGGPMARALTAGHFLWHGAWK